MRKLYSFITMLLCAMCSLTMQAQTTTENIDFTFCLQIDDPSCWVLRDINSTIVSLQAGENVLTTTLHKTSYSDGSSYAYSDTYYLSLADDKTNDYKISGCDIEVGGSRTPWSGFNGSPTSMSITFTKVEENGCTLYPACANLNDLRTATATVNVDDASKVQMRCGYFGYMPTLVDGQNTIKFNPTDEANWTIGAKNYNEYLGGVTQNGNKVTENYGSYNLTVADNDVIDINTKVDDTPVAVTFSFANAGTEAAVTNVYKFVNYAREAVADWQNGFEVAPRTQIILTLDMNNYKFNTVTVNGTAQQLYSSDLYVTVSEATQIVVDANKYSTFDVKLSLTDPNHVSVKVAQSEYGASTELTDLVAGEQVVSVSELNTVMLVSEKNSAILDKVAYITNEGTEQAATKGYNGYTVPLTGTAAVVVESHEKVRNDKATLQINDLAKLNMVYMQYADGTNIVHSYMGPTPELEQTFMFDANGDNPFSLYFSPLDYENPGCVTVNGEVVAPTYEKGTSYQLQLKDGDVVKVWAGETPSADDSYSITVNVDAADRLFYVDYDEATYEWAKVSMKAGKNVIKFKEDTYLPINVEDGFGVSSFTCLTTGEPIEEFYGSFPLELTPAMDGYEYNVVTFNEDDFRTGEMSVWVDDASNVDIYYEGSGKKATALTNGDNIFKYNPETESTIRICSKDYLKSLYKVLVNGERVEPSYGEFYVTCDPANKVEIFATFPDVTVPVTFSFANEGTEGAIREVTVNGEAVADYSNFTVKMGDQLGIDLNTTDYNITSLTKNGQEQDDFQYGWSSVVTDEELNFVVTAKPWGNVAFTITINDPKAVTIYKGEMWNDDKFTDLVAGENKVEMPASLSMITIQANSAAVINSVTKNGKLQDGGMGYFVEIADGDQIVIDAKSAVRTAKAIVWVDDVTKANLLCGMGRADDTPFDDVDGILQSGENVVMFDASIDNPFYLTFAGDDLNEGDVKVFINESTESLVPLFNNYFPNITLADGDYIRVYLNEIPDAITSIESTTETTAAYNLAGQRVTKAYKGLVIKNGKKFVVK